MQTQPLRWFTTQLVFVHVDITCWSGKKTLTPEDLGLDRQQLPPESLVSLGEKQLIDPAALREFTSLRSAARRHCLAVGTRFMGGYAVPTAKAAVLLNTLDDLQQRYTEARAAFLQHYDQCLATWAAQQPVQWQKLIQDALVPAEYVGGRLNFAVQAVHIEPPDGDSDVGTHPGFAHALNGLGDQVFHDIALLARDTLIHSFQGKTTVTRRALSPLQTMRDKLEGLSFVDSRCGVVIGELDRLLSAVGQRTPITGAVLSQIRQFLSLAAQPEGLRTWQTSTPVHNGLVLSECLIVTDDEPVVEPLAPEDRVSCPPAPASRATPPTRSGDSPGAGWFF